MVDDSEVDDSDVDETDVDESDVDLTDSAVDEVSKVNEEATEGMLLGTELCFIDAEVSREELLSS